MFRLTSGSLLGVAHLFIFKTSKSSKELIPDIISTLDRFALHEQPKQTGSQHVLSGTSADITDGAKTVFWTMSSDEVGT